MTESDKVKRPFRDLEIEHSQGKTIIRNLPAKKAVAIVKGTKTNNRWESIRFKNIKEIRQLRPGTNETDCVPYSGGEKENT